MLFEFFVGVWQGNVVDYDKQHNYNTIWNEMEEYEMEENSSIVDSKKLKFAWHFLPTLDCGQCI